MTSPSIEDMLPAPIPQPNVALQARLIVKPTDEEKLTFVRTTDTRTAMAQGLAQYLAPTEIDWCGRLLRFNKMFQVWAEPEDVAVLPACAVIAITDADYQANVLTPTTRKIDDGTNRYVRIVAELRQVFVIAVWSTDPQERMGLTAALEDALEPVEWMTGVRLELPFYFNARATFEKLSVLYDDAPSTSQKRWRRSLITVVGNIPQIRPVGPIALSRIESRTIVTDPSDPPRP